MFSLILVLFSTYHTIQNGSVSVTVNDALCAYRPGAIVLLKDKWSGSEITSGLQFSGINTGCYLPANGVVTVSSDTSLTFHSTHMTDGSDALPVAITIDYTLVGRGLEMRYKFLFTEDTEVLSPLEIDYGIMGWDTISAMNQSAVDEVFALDGTHDWQRFSGDQVFRLSGGLPSAVFLMPNTAKSMSVVLDHDSYAYLSLRILEVEEPRETAVGPDLHSIIPAGQTEEYYVRLSLDEYFAPVFISGHLNGAERAAAWMMDELTFIHPDQGDIWGFSETPEGDEVVSAALINLLEIHPEMKMNWIILPDGILTPNRDSVWYEPGYEDSWSHWHGTWRMSTEATPEYLQWMLNIQNDIYPWADRVRMGSHGYHHTPNPDSSYGEFHEFITYEPEEHQERFRVNMLDLDACGLDTNMVRVIRFSGHRTSLSGLQAIIDHGFTFFCNGWRLIDWYAGKQFKNQWISRYQTVNGRIWGSNSVWWGDYSVPVPGEILAYSMDRGKFGLMGCHPINMLDAGCGTVNPTAYNRVDSVLTSLENDYENFMWMFPGEYGDFLEDCFNINTTSIVGQGDELSLAFNGYVPEGLTFCAMLGPSDIVNGVYLDGNSIPWELRSGDRLFAVAGSRPDGDHLLTIDIDPLGVEEESPSQGFGLCALNPSVNGMISLSISGYPEGEPALVSIYDTSGRIVDSRYSVPESGRLELSCNLLPGMYFVTVEALGRTAVTRSVVIP
ncbi:hypothetical protein CSA37_10525 [Candidatus Fermentibacteria bacterium]|nr:MAG: hypothetical protein CSA37_10525 [Candidatus Fermentibacteria bacterium]